MDATLACVALALAAWVRSRFPNAWGGYADTPTYYWPLALICMGGFPLLLSAFGFYDLSLRRTRLGTIWVLAKACAALFVLMVLVQFVFKFEYSRPVLIAHGAATFWLVLLRRELTTLLRRSKGMRDGFARRVMVIGSADELELLARQISSADHVVVVECVDVQELEPRLLEHLVERLHRHAVNSVLLSLPLPQLNIAEQVVRICEEEGVEIVLMADFLAQKISRVECSRLFGHPVLVYTTSSSKIYENIGKRALDVMGASVLLLLLSPVLLFAAGAVKLSSPGPILFRQKRAGVNGRDFIMLKFRTMQADAEAAKHALLAKNEMSGPVFKLKNDPRVTPVGRFLRKYSIDETPQLWNILRGEMSLVGPRPLPVDEVSKFSKRAHRRRMSVKPGLTCLWQVAGRNDITDFEKWVELDIQYIDTWSMAGDLGILVRTIPAVLSGRGAK